MRNWFKYQVDSTASERVKRSRYKRRGEVEEKREEKIPPNPQTSLPSATSKATPNGNGWAPESSPASKLPPAVKAKLKPGHYDTPEDEIIGPEEFAKIKSGIGQKTQEAEIDDFF